MPFIPTPQTLRHLFWILLLVTLPSAGATSVAATSVAATSVAATSGEVPRSEEASKPEIQQSSQSASSRSADILNQEEGTQKPQVDVPDPSTPCLLGLGLVIVSLVKRKTGKHS